MRVRLESRVRRATTMPLMILLPALLLGLAAPVFAVKPGQWSHTTEADFEPGEVDSVVVTNLGDLKLTAGVEVIGEMPEQASIIYDLQNLGGVTYLAAGPEAKLLRRNNDAFVEVAELEAQQLFTLDVFDSKLLLGISGATSRLALLDGEELVDLHELEDVRYIWEMVVVGDVVYLATGTKGKLLAVDLTDRAAPVVTELLDASQSNLLCMGRDGKGRLYVGTDGDGLVYRVTPAAKADGEADVFVVYDAGEPEVGALLVRADGTVYAGTADADQAKPGRLEKAKAKQSGRPEGSAKKGGKKGEGDGGEAKPGDGDSDLPGTPPEPTPLNEGSGAETDAAKADEAAPDRGEATAEATATAEGDAKAEGAAKVEGDATAEGDAKAEPAAPAAPTAEQREQLREVIRERLLAAREAGELQAGAGGSRKVTRSATPRSRSRPRAAAKASKKGNAIYRVDPDGFVAEVFRESVMILRIAELPTGALLVATGNEGQLFRVNPAADETTTLTAIEPQQIPAMLVDREGVLLGAANPAQLMRLGDGFAESGAYTSQVLDAKQISEWGVLHLTADLPAGTQVMVQTRTGNVADPEKGPWSPWSPEGEAGLHVVRPGMAKPYVPVEVDVTSPVARFFQYRLTLMGSGEKTPVVDRVELAYLTRNRKPAIESVMVGVARAASSSKNAEKEPDSPDKLQVVWKAADPNGDRLTYTVEYRRADTKKWITLEDELDQPKCEWQTVRVPDGRYLVRVTASDAPENVKGTELEATRVSDPVVVDNTPPAVLRAQVVQVGEVIRVVGAVRDATSRIRAIHYSVDAANDWQPILPKDRIFDSTGEAFEFTLEGLSAGPHIVTLRVTDTRNNAAYRALNIEIGE